MWPCSAAAAVAGGLLLFVVCAPCVCAKLAKGLPNHDNNNNNIPQQQQSFHDSLEGDIFADDLLHEERAKGQVPPPAPPMWFLPAGGGGGGGANASSFINPFGQLAGWFGVEPKSDNNNNSGNNQDDNDHKNKAHKSGDQLHFADYHFLFNAEHHTVFQLHTPILPAAADDATPIGGANDRLRRRSNNNNTNHNNINSDPNKTAIATATAAQNRILFNALGAAFGVYPPKPTQLLGGGGEAPTGDAAAVVVGKPPPPPPPPPAVHVEEVQLNNAASLRQSRFNPFNPTRILIHGWFGHANAGIYHTLVPAYVRLSHARRTPYNIVTVDWGRGAIADYITASYRVKSVGRTVARFIDFLHAEAGVRFADVEVIGFSMGAHIAGMAGKHVQTGRLPLIYALDPALPFFRYERIAERVAVTDADYVEVIHTSVGSYGYDRPLGHADFYVNWGGAQPGCFLNECNHVRAFQVFAETLQPSAAASSSGGGNSSQSAAVESATLWGQGCDVSVWQDMVRQRRCAMPNGLRLAMGGDGKNVTALRGRGGVYYVTATSSAPFVFP